MFIDIPDPFFENMRFSKYKSHFGDLFGYADDIIMYGSQDSAAMVNSIRLVSITKMYRPCGVYTTNNKYKYSIEKKETLHMNF